MNTHRNWLFLLALLPACTMNVDTGEQPEEPIAQDHQALNGPDEPGEPASMLIRFSYGPDMRGSGTLIAPNVVLTNAHASPGGALGMYVQNATYTQPGVDPIQVIDKEHHPNYTAPGDDYDLGLLRLGCAVTDVTPAQINRTPLEYAMVHGDAVKLVGYGPSMSHNGTDWGTKRSLNTSLGQLDPFSFYAPGSAFKGDSGGSAYGWPDKLQDDGGGGVGESAKKSSTYKGRRLIGVITTTGVGMRRVDKHWQWIDNMVAQWADPSLAPRPSVRTLNEATAPNVCPSTTTPGHYTIQNPEPNTTYSWSASSGTSVTPNGTSAVVFTSGTGPFTLTVTAEGPSGCARTFSETFGPTQNNCDQH